MALRFKTLSELLDTEFDTVIDVRSPAEFAEDHVPGAINLPALSNAERARVGTIYTQVSPFDARKIGAALVARNVAAHLEGPLKDKDGSWRPLLYCWRGGQRSGSVATILKAVGWRAETIEGGYQSYRRLVHAVLYEADLPCPVVLLDGNTGTAKTALLPLLVARGVQVIDLEGLAGHRGSLLGSVGEQPAQKAFESALAAQIVRLDPSRPVLLEAESSKIGARILPPKLWEAMKEAPRIEISAPVAARAAFLQEAYADMVEAPERMARALEPLRQYRGHARVDAWQKMLRDGDFLSLARALIEEHYDPAYARSRAAHDPRFLARVSVDRLDAPGRAALADKVAAALSGS